MDIHLRRLIFPLASNEAVQRILAWNVRVSQYLMGIGSGSSVTASGEGAVLALAARRQREDPVCVFDVGANQGEYVTLALKILAGRDFMLHAFEPSGTAFRALHDAVGGRPNVHLNNCALGSARGSATLYYDHPGSGLASLTRRRLRHLDIEFGLSESVAVETIDDYCTMHRVARIDLLKLDVEGHELSVLEGAAQMLGGRRIAAVGFEFGGCNIDTRTYLRDFFDLFQGYRMRLARVTPSGYLVDLPRYREAYEQFQTSNFVAFRDQLPAAAQDVGPHR